jgi:hypothetical protein
LVREGEILVTLMPENKVLERQSGLLPSKKELLEQHSGAFTLECRYSVLCFQKLRRNTLRLKQNVYSGKNTTDQSKIFILFMWLENSG